MPSQAEVDAGVPEYDLIKMVNCASCYRELLGMCEADWFYKLPRSLRTMYPPMSCRHNDRPYCLDCHAFLTVEEGHNPETLLHGIQPLPEDTTPTQDNAIRAIEDHGEGLLEGYE